MIFSLLLLSDAATGASLNELINQNVKDANTAYEHTLPPAQQPTQPARVWVHIRSDSQKGTAQELLDSLAKNESGQWQIEKKPIRVVSYGPGKSQLRYFKKQDRKQATALFNALHQKIPQLELKDFSEKYERVGWIKPGHYELWLSQDL